MVGYPLNLFSNWDLSIERARDESKTFFYKKMKTQILQLVSADVQEI